MHYHVKVGLPAGSFRDCKDWDELQGRIFAEINLVMRKYDDSGEIDEGEMEEFGITPCYYEEDEGTGEADMKSRYNPEGIYDWYEIGGRWRLNMIPDELNEYERSLIDKFRGMYESLHTSMLHDDCDIPFHLITWEEPHDMLSIERYDIDKEEQELFDNSFKKFLKSFNKDGKYDDYIWTTVDIHN